VVPPRAVSEPAGEQEYGGGPERRQYWRWPARSCGTRWLHA
jgi:hypothetical protein